MVVAPASRTSSRRRPNASRRRLAGVRRAAARLRSTTTSTTATFSTPRRERSRASSEFRRVTRKTNLTRDDARVRARVTLETFRDESLDDERTNDGARVAFECERRRSVFRALVSVGKRRRRVHRERLADVAAERLLEPSSSTFTRFIRSIGSMPTTETRFRGDVRRASRSFREFRFRFRFRLRRRRERTRSAREHRRLVDASSSGEQQQAVARGESPRRHAAETDWKAASVPRGARHPSSGASSARRRGPAATNRSRGTRTDR